MACSKLVQTGNSDVESSMLAIMEISTVLEGESIEHFVNEYQSEEKEQEETGGAEEGEQERSERRRKGMGCLSGTGKEMREGVREEPVSAGTWGVYGQ